MVYSFVYNSVRYYYLRDLQQRIIGIVDEEGNYVAGYKYDSYGQLEIIADTDEARSIAQANPFRYKGYYYDENTKLYYCKSRYYNPEWCRWLTADDIGYLNPKEIIGLNLFAYCGNDPINKLDPIGHFGIFLGLIIGAIVGGIVGSAVNNLTNGIYYNNTSPNEGDNYLSDNFGVVSIDDYQNEYVTRWDRLQSIKDMYYQNGYGSTSFGFDQWRSYSEYNLHMYGWMATGWAFKTEIPIFSEIAKRSLAADLKPNDWDPRWYVNVVAILLGLLGL